MQTPEGKVETVPVPWAGQRSRFTLRYERFAIAVRRACRSVSAAAELLRLSWEELQTIMERGSPVHRPPLFPSASSAVQRGLERRELEGLRQVGMDEKSFGRGQSSVSLLTDLDRARVLEVMKDNHREAADLLLATLPPEVRAAIKAVCIDRSGHFAAAAREGLPEAALGHDRFHLSAHLNDGSPVHQPPLFPSASSAVAAVHREENQRLQKLGDDRLKGTQRLFGFDPDKLGEEQAVRFAELKGSDMAALRVFQPLFFGPQMELHPALHIVGFLILVSFTHSEGMVEKTLAHARRACQKSVLQAPTSVMNRKSWVMPSKLLACASSMKLATSS